MHKYDYFILNKVIERNARVLQGLYQNSAVRIVLQLLF